MTLKWTDFLAFSKEDQFEFKEIDNWSSQKLLMLMKLK